ncbi:MAG: TrkA C-terminal domain-containing protein, partial [Rikenellaceae bacterium]
IASLGLSLGVLDANIYPVIVSVSIITTFVTPYIMRLALPLYNRIFKSVPYSWQVVISQYGSGKRLLNHESDWKHILKSYIIRVVIHSGWLTAILVFTLKGIMPFAKAEFGDKWWVAAIVALLSISMMAPFIYALIAGRTASAVFKKLWSDAKYSRGPLLTLIIIRFLISAFFVGVLLASLFRIPLFILLPTVVFILSVVLLSRSVNKYYHQIESRFLRNLNRHTTGKVVIPYSLANEIHTELFEVANESVIVGKSISEIHKKHRTGAQVVTIYRHHTRIDLPRKDEIIHGGDKLVIIGNDDQLLNFRDCIETIERQVPASVVDNKELELYQVTLTKNSILLGEKAHVSILRDKYNFLLVGYQSNTNEFHRPNPTYYFAEDDTVWAVGRKDIVNNLM